MLLCLATLRAERFVRSGKENVRFLLYKRRDVEVDTCLLLPSSGTASFELDGHFHMLFLLSSAKGTRPNLEDFQRRVVYGQ